MAELIYLILVGPPLIFLVALIYFLLAAAAHAVFPAVERIYPRWLTDACRRF